MGGFIKSNVQREKHSVLNTVVDKEVFEGFKGFCKRYNYPMNLMIELCMKQFIDGKISINIERAVEINKLTEENSMLNTTINADIYQKFKVYCKANKYVMKNVILGFMMNFVDGKFAVEVREIDD